MNRPLRSPDALAAAGLVSPAELPALRAVAARYAVSITQDMAELIDASDPHDPIARQFVPRAEEAATAPEERADPIGDAVHEKLLAPLKTDNLVKTRRTVARRQIRVTVL